MSLFGTTSRRLTTTALIAALIISTALPVSWAMAADEPIFAPGEPIVTGFAGVIAPDAPPDGADPLDYTFINPDGQSMVIQQLQPDGAPDGQLIDSPAVFSATAKDIGQVFGVTLDDAPEATGAAAPNIYLAATSAFGLNITVPDPDGNPMRSRLGGADASFMAGQWGSAGGAEGYPGSIWKVDGTTGEISLFSTIATNSGAGLGGIVYDAASAQFFVSDLDTGLIYRLAEDGSILDTYDHGVTGRPVLGLDPVEDDGSQVDITDPAFNSEDPSTWGFTSPERKVDGLAVHGGRLFYAVAEGPSIWSVRINSDGSFGVPRWELDAMGLGSNNEITSIAFDAQGRMILAQRGPQAGSYDYSVFAEPGTSSVVRYKREFPYDPSTPSTWAQDPDSYAIGVATEGSNASGGVALGYGFNAEDGDFSGACNAFVWATGDALRNNPDLTPPLDGPAYVHGLQGAARTLLRPLNDPPTTAFFADYDGNTDDETAVEAGHVGAVAIWQVCEGGPSAPPDDTEAPDFIPPPDFVAPEHFNLTLEKWAKPHFCFDGGADYWCNYTIRVENTGTVPYWGTVNVHDELPAHPPGASMLFWPQPNWFCGPTGPTAFNCSRGPVLLYPGDGVVLHELVKLPKPVAAGFCQLVNVAGLQWPFWGHDEDPSDDFGVGIAGIPAPGCVAPGGVSDLSLTKVSFPASCIDNAVDWLCNYAVIVQNAGPGNYSGPITVKDTLGVNAPANTFGPWTCGQVGPVLTCNINAAPVNVPPGWSSGFFVQAHVPKPVGPPLCDLDNKANIVLPLGGAPNNILPGNDFDSATTHIPSPACLGPQPQSDLKITKSAQGCFPFFGGYICKWQMTLTNVGPDAYVGPITFKDTSLGATGNQLTTLLPWCSGTSVVTCDHPAPVLLAPGVPHTLNFVTGYAGGPAVCSATNEIAILDPNPGSVPNPAGNDSASIGQTIPNPACLGLPVLNIIKTAKGCASDPSSTDWLCKFDIKVKNLGLVAQPGPILVRDINTKPTTFNTPACLPFAANQWQCTRALPLAPGATWSFTATTKVDPNGVTLADCNVDNTVAITSPLSADPGHFSQANQKVPQLFINPGPGPVFVYCDPPSLKLSKVAGTTVKSGDGYDSSFTIKAVSTGPDPYHGTVELDEVLPDGTSYVSSSWTCVPTTGNDVHCSSPYKDIPVGKYTSMTITIHIPKDVAVDAKCNVVNTVNAAISAEVLHSDQGAQYTASAKAILPASACRSEPACPINQVKPDGKCCPADTVWNGKQCAPPKPKCPDDSHLTDNGSCVCDKGTEGKPGRCTPIVEQPTCPDHSHLTTSGKCVCDKGTEGKPGRCTPIVEQPTCPDDSHLNNAGQCVCDKGTEGKPGRCTPIEVEPICPDDSHLNNAGQCVCDKGTEGRPGRCTPIVEQPTCPDDSHLSDSGKCVCNAPLTGRPGQCQIDIVIELPTACPDDSHFDKRRKSCVCNAPMTGEPGQCQAEIVIQKPTSCPDDSHFDTRRNACVCNKPLTGEPGQCTADLVLQLPVIK